MHHYKLHRGEQDYKCGVCGRMYYTKSGLQHHQRQVHSPGNFPCPECPAEAPTVLATKFDLLAHRRSAHGGANSEKCGVCSARFAGPAELKEHRVQCHSNRPFACPRCPHRSKTQDKLERHLVRHVSRDAFRCAHCAKTFAFKNSLKKHLEKGRCAVLKQQLHQKDGEEALGQLRRLLAERPDLAVRQQSHLQQQQQQASAAPPVQTLLQAQLQAPIAAATGKPAS